MLFKLAKKEFDRTTRTWDMRDRREMRTTDVRCTLVEGLSLNHSVPIDHILPRTTDRHGLLGQ